MFGQKDDNSADQPAEGAGGHPPIASAATDPAASLSDNGAWQHPGPAFAQPNADSSAEAVPNKDVISPVGGFPVAVGDKTIVGSSDDSPNDDLISTTDVDNSDLVEIKQKALSELVPLVDQLDQTPEEKFRTIMMMLQASDDQSLVEKAYETAHSIENEKVRAQALLDIVNEINYFTQPPAAPSA